MTDDGALAQATRYANSTPGRLQLFPMHNINADLVARAIDILSTDGLSEDDIESRVLELSQEPMLARRLIDWLPEVFGLVLVPHLAELKLPTTFAVKSSSGQWINLEFKAEPIFPIALRMGIEMYHAGPAQKFRKIVLRSSILACANNALKDGVSLEGSTLSGPAMTNIPAEVYLFGRKPFWRRLLQRFS